MPPQPILPISQPNGYGPAVTDTVFVIFLDRIQSFHMQAKNN